MLSITGLSQKMGPIQTGLWVHTHLRLGGCEQMQQRLDQLKTEYSSKQQELTQVQTQNAELSNTLQRISGAIQVLQEQMAAMP